MSFEVYNLNYDRTAALKALSFINPDCGYDDWIKVGMALKSCGGVLADWEEWSRGGSKFEDGACGRHWNSFDIKGKISVGTLIYMAKQNGYESINVKFEEKKITNKENILDTCITRDAYFIDTCKKVNAEDFELVKEYVYKNEKGNPVIIVKRWEKVIVDPATGERKKEKKFMQKTPTGEYSVKGIERPLYMLPELLATPMDTLVFIVEGEKDVETLVELGFSATTTGGAMSRISPSSLVHLKGKQIVFFPDNDEPGKKYVENAAKLLDGIAGQIKVIDSSVLGLAEKGDISDLIQIWREEEALPDSEIISRLIEIVKNTSVYGDPTEKEWGSPIMEDGKKNELNQAYFPARYSHMFLVVYDAVSMRFYKYADKTGLWQSQSDAIIEKELGILVQKVLGEKEKNQLLYKRTSSFIKGMANLLKGMTERSDVFERKPHVIHVANGVLELAADESRWTLKPFSPKYFSRNRTEIDWNQKAECPDFIDMLLRPALNDDDIELVQKYFGQCLLGYNPSQTFLLLRGTAGGGKSTLVEIIEKIVGISNVSELRVPHLNSRFELIRCIGKTLLTGKDVPGDFLDSAPAHMIKKLVGNDLLVGEVKGGNIPFNIRGDFNLIITSNTRLRIHLDSDVAAWERRMLIIDYDRPRPEKPIPEFADKLLAKEGAGILRWGIEGALKLLQEVNSGGISLTDAQKKRVDDLLYESDSVGAFINDVVIPHEEMDITVDELSLAYRSFCDRKGWEPIGLYGFQREISNAMLNMRHAVKRNDIRRNGKNQRGFAGFTCVRIE